MSSSAVDPRVWVANTLQRVTPVIVAFLGLRSMAWPRRGGAARPRLVTRQMIHGMGPAVCLGGLLGLLFAAVAAAAYATMPARFLIATQDWTPRDWETHLEDVISRPGVAPGSARRHSPVAGRSYAPAEPRIALEHYRKAAAFQSNSAEFRADLANAFLAIGQFRRSDRAMPRGVGAQSPLLRGPQLPGAALAGCGLLDEAAASYRKALEVEPDYAEAHAILVSHYGSGRIGEAIAHFQRALEITPDDAEAHNDLGFALAAAGSTRRWPISRPEINPDHVQARNNLGLALAGAAGSTRRWRNTRRPWKSSPTMPRPTSIWASPWQDAAGSTRRCAVPGGPEDQARLRRGPRPSGHCLDGARPDRRGDGALPAGPGNQARLRRGPRTIWASPCGPGRIDAAIAQFQKALEIKPDYAEAHISLGAALADRGRIDEAIAHFRKALKSSPTTPRPTQSGRRSCGRGRSTRRWPISRRP